MSVLASVDEFLEVLKKSGLVEAAPLEKELDDLAGDRGLPSKPSQLAALLVRRGLLTNFQATQLVNGRWHGFFVAGKYKLLEPLGAGGMGKVFLCAHTLLKRLVAIKILPSEKMSEPSMVERFYREARAIAALNHPNIVRCHDVDRDQKLHYLVMEYVDGVSLQQLVAQTGPLDPVRAAHYVSQTAAGLQHAHEAGWVHRDIKPGNLLVDRKGVVKILDLGLARILLDSRDQLTKDLDDKAVLGTADYLAPEQAMSSHDVDIRADIYGLGASFYFLLGGRPPFAEGTVTQKLLWHQVKEPTHIRELRPEVPVPLAAVLHRMMAKDPAQRYQVPTEVVEALVPWTATPIDPPAESELPQRSAAVRSLQPLSGPGLTNNTGPGSGVRIADAGPGSQVKPDSPSSNVLRPPSSGKLVAAANGTGAIVPSGPGTQRLLLAALLGVLVAGALGLGVWAVFFRSSGTSVVTIPPTTPEPPPPRPVVKTVAPEDAGKFLDQDCTVRMLIRSVGADKERFFFNSEKDFRSETNFAIVIDRTNADSLATAELTEIRKRYQNKRIHVSGTVTKFKERPQMRITALSQIQIIEGEP